MDDMEHEASLSAALARHRRLQEAEGVCPAMLSLEQTHHLARAFGCEVGQVELAALRAHILPERYRRNLGTVGWEGQIRILEATVAIVGAGGLGGWVIEGLARMGVGHLIVIDDDYFQENNLNRQLGCTEKTLGQSKVKCLAERVAEVNGAVHVTTQVVWLDEQNATGLLAGAQVVVDALDTLPARLVLEKAAASLGIPLVHGAIGGYSGQVMTVFPRDPGLRALYGEGPLPERGVETQLGNPAATPMMISAWQIQEVVKILCDQGDLVRNRMLLMDAESGDVTEIRLGDPPAGCP